VQVSTLEDMRRFILEHSDFSRAQTNVTKHVNIVTQLSEVVAARSLMDVSTVSVSGCKHGGYRCVEVLTCM
jgi:vacuolar protein sorting-associated protein 45